MIEAKKQNNVRASSGKPYHRYAGLLKCGDCGCTFVAKIRRWRDKPERVEYVCNGYHRYKGYCTSHRVQERDLDALIYKELLRIKSQAEEKWKSIEKDVKAISNANLKLLISEIIILEQDNELSIVVAMKAPFGEYYGELFDEEGNTVLAHSGDYKSIT